MTAITQHASPGRVVEALLAAAAAPPADRRSRTRAALHALTSITGIVAVHHLDDGDDQDRACLDDLVPALGSLVSARRFVRPRHDLTPASADRLQTPGATVFVGFTDVAFDRRWGALVVGLDGDGARRVSQFDGLHEIGAVAGWLARSARATSPADPGETSASTPDDERPVDGSPGEADPWTGAVVDLVPHGVVFHCGPHDATLRNRRAASMEAEWRATTGTSSDAWDGGRFLRAHHAPDGRTAPEIIRVAGLPTWWRRTTVLRAEGGAILGMLTEFGPLDRTGDIAIVADASTTEATLDRARTAIATSLPSMSDDERAVVEQVLHGRRMSSAARELHMGERRARELLREVLARLDPIRQAELAVLVRRTSTVS